MDAGVRPGEEEAGNGSVDESSKRTCKGYQNLSLQRKEKNELKTDQGVNKFLEAGMGNTRFWIRYR